MNQKQVAIVTCFYREEFSEDEQISLTHLLHYLGRYDKFIVKPPRVKAALPGFQIRNFPARHFQSAQTHGQLQLMRKYYEAFADYEYILIYQIDSLVFADQLETWCQKGYDFIGAPWIKENMLKRYDYPDAVGNGGFSLRKVKNFLKVIDRARQTPLELAMNLMRAAPSPRNMRQAWQNSAAERTALNEDRFWAFEAKKYYPEFKIPSVAEGLKFAFELNPKKCFELNHKELPFGAHAFGKYDRGFWKPHLLPNQVSGSLTSTPK